MAAAAARLRECLADRDVEIDDDDALRVAGAVITAFVVSRGGICGGTHPDPGCRR